MTAVALFDEDRHEDLVGAVWNESSARAAIDSIVADTIATFSPDGFWPIHPIDRSPERAEVLTPIYYGAAGVVWALHHLDQLPTTIASALPDIAASNRRTGPSDGTGLLLGSAGIELLSHLIDRTPTPFPAQSFARDEDRPANGILWGRAGSALGALHLHRATANDSSLAVFRTLVQSLVDEWRAFDGAWLWHAPLYGHTDRMLSALHGMAGNLAPIVVGRAYLPPQTRDLAAERISTTLERTAIRDGALVNWQLVYGDSTRPTAHTRLLQHCNGAPGVVNVFGAWPDPRIDELLRGAGELIWRAGPIKKRPSLCHGVPGSGFAFLRLFERTGDEVWLDRARRFAMHAIAQDGRALAETGQRKYSLWTGDLGLAVYLDHCLEGRPGFPTIDYF